MIGHENVGPQSYVEFAPHLLDGFSQPTIRSVGLKEFEFLIATEGQLVGMAGLVISSSLATLRVHIPCGQPNELRNEWDPMLHGWPKRSLRRPGALLQPGPGASQAPPRPPRNAINPPRILNCRAWLSKPSTLFVPDSLDSSALCHGSLTLRSKCLKIRDKNSHLISTTKNSRVKQNFLGIGVAIAYHQQEPTPPAAGFDGVRSRAPFRFRGHRAWFWESPPTGEGGGRLGIYGLG